MIKSKFISGRKYFFRKFARKKYSVFNSMHKTVHISTLVFAYSLIISPAIASNQDDTLSISKVIDLEEVEIVGQLSPSVFEEVPRLVTIISSSETECAPAQSLTDLLQYTGAIDIRQRGKAGIQSDISIRGGSFDHNLILLNGLNISDPQTGHLSLNLPIETESLQRIEILNGPAARVHGVNSFSGAINFVTQPSPINSLSLESSGGEYDYLRNSATLNLSIGNVTSLSHYNNGYSSGYTKNTDYFKQGVFYHGQVKLEDDLLDIQFGHNNRSFGSNSFYTPKYPDQYEENQLSFFSLGYKTGKKIKIHPQIYWRRHRDRWEMFREDPNWYKVENGMSISNDTSLTAFDTTFIFTNHHINDVIGAQLNLSKRTSLGVTTVGWHLRSENINSTNIGYDRGIVTPVRGYDSLNYILSDNRSSLNIHLEQTFAINKFYFSGGALLNWNSYVPDEINIFPGLDFRYTIFHKLYLVGSYNYTMGLPTFTDLTYEDVNNSGNNKLKPYTQHSFETGLKWQKGRSSVTTAFFYNQGKDVIDWIWFEEDMKFSPVNISKYSARGIEFTGLLKFEEGSMASRIISSTHFSYTFIDMRKDIPGEVLKYFNLRNKAAILFQSKPLENLTVAWNFRFVDREGSYLTWDVPSTTITDIENPDKTYVSVPFDPYFLLDVRITYEWNKFSIFLESTNLLDTDYIDIGTIQQPGRWITGGLKFKIEGF